MCALPVCPVLIESDWNLKVRRLSNAAFAELSINRIRLEFKVDSI